MRYQNMLNKDRQSKLWYRCIFCYRLLNDEREVSEANLPRVLIKYVKVVKFASTSFLKYMEATLTTFTYVMKIVIFATPYCMMQSKVHARLHLESNWRLTPNICTNLISHYENYNVPILYTISNLQGLWIVNKITKVRFPIGCAIFSKH